MVKLVKSSLLATLNTKKATELEFRTCLTQAEGVVNSRPLTALVSDTQQMLPITPAHLMIGRAINSLPGALCVDKEQLKISVQWRNRSKLSSAFFSRFQNEYIMNLHSLSKWTETGKAPKIGEIVLIKMENKGRREWPLARITELIFGRDSKVRNVSVRTSQGLDLRRHVNHIYKLEYSEE